MGQRRLLIVDDDLDLLVTLKQFFERRDYLVWVANSGEEAVQLVRRRQPHVVLLDRHLGGGGLQGLEVLQRITREWPNTVVVMLEKPFSVAALLRTLQQTIGAGPAPQPGGERT
jgi:DNA-binding response OmpR family regulator